MPFSMASITVLFGFVYSSISLADFVVVVINQLTMSPNTILPTELRWVLSVGIRLYVVALALPMLFRYLIDAALRSI